MFLQSRLSAVQRERDELAEANNSLQKMVADLEQEIQRWVGHHVGLMEPCYGVLGNMISNFSCC